MNLLRAYGKRVQEFPLLTESMMTAGLFGLGDILSQRLVERRERHDFKRTARFLVFGGLVAGPLLSRWYGVLNRKVVLANSFAGLCARVALDQLVFTPVFISVFFTGMGLMEGKNLGELREKLAETFQGTLVANWKLWIPFQFVNFYVTPPAYRLLAVNMTATGWNTFLAYTNERANRKLARQSNEPVKR